MVNPIHAAGLHPYHGVCTLQVGQAVSQLMSVETDECLRGMQHHKHTFLQGVQCNQLKLWSMLKYTVTLYCLDVFGAAVSCDGLVQPSGFRVVRYSTAM